jgi:hypothetical protein
MTAQRILTHACAALIMSVAFAACSDDGGPDAGFDRRTMLTPSSTNLIKPGYDSLALTVTALATATDAFVASPSVVTLEPVRAAWKAAHSAWQWVQMYDFGPAESSSGTLFQTIGTFPVDVAKLEAYVQNADTTFANFDRNTRGFAGCEYLLYSDPDPTLVVAAFSLQLSRGMYLRSVVRDIKTRVDTAQAAWNGSYGTSFAADNTTSAGSSISMLFNGFSQSYEILKNYKVALPAGLRAGQTQPQPSATDAYFSETSLTALRTHLNAVIGQWRGTKRNGMDDVGFVEYLNSVSGGPQLVAETEMQITATIAALDALDQQQSIAGNILQYPDRVSALMTELQKLTRFFKSEMSSRLGIAITYASGDGD